MSSIRTQRLPSHVADHVHHLRLAGPLAPLVADGDRHVDALGQAAGTHHAADVGRHHHQVGRSVALLDVAHHHRRGEQVVGRYVEEALDLAGVQIDRHDAVDAGALDQVGDQLGRDRRARSGPAVLPGVAEVGHHRRDAPRHRPLQRVDQDQQFHQIVVGGKRRRLQDIDVLAAHVLLHLDEHFHVREALHHALGRAVSSRMPEIASASGRLLLPATSFMCGAPRPRLASRVSKGIAALRSHEAPSSKRRRAL